MSLTPFLMAGVRHWIVPGRLSGLPFPETTLRTQVRGPDGWDGLWFLSLDVSCPAMLAARAIGAPYQVGRPGVSRSRDARAYAGSRRGSGASHRLTVRPGGPVRPSPRDVWLTSRRCACTRRLGMVWETPAEHEPCPPHEVAVDKLEQSPTRAVGLPSPGAEPVAHFSDGVRRVRTGGLRHVHRVHGAERRARHRAAVGR